MENSRENKRLVSLLKRFAQIELVLMGIAGLIGLITGGMSITDYTAVLVFLNFYLLASFLAATHDEKYGPEYRYPL